MEKGEPIRKQFLNHIALRRVPLLGDCSCSNSKQMGSGFLMRLLLTAGLWGGVVAQG